jgi:hypothetical protein
MRAVVWTLFFLFAPGAWFVVQSEGLRWLCEGEPPRALRPLDTRLRRLAAAARGRRRTEPLPQVLLALELRRLSAEVRTVEAGRQPHRAARLNAALAAYDRVLLELCESVDVPAPHGLPPLSAHARLDLETELLASGVDW